MNPAEMAEKLTFWIRQQVTDAGSEGDVFGFSGGVDSAVVAALSKRAFPDNCLGVIMPCHSNPQDAEHAGLVAETFDIPTRLVPLDNVNDTLLDAIHEGDGLERGMRAAETNARARLRMVTLYYFAACFNYLVVGTGNRSEIAVGYFTKYGDGGVDIEPLGNLLKREVRQLATYLGVPQAIIDKPPTAGLWPGQTDEDEMGVSYDQLDDYLLSGTASDEVRARIEEIMAGCQHKLDVPPTPDF